MQNSWDPNEEESEVGSAGEYTVAHNLVYCHYVKWHPVGILFSEEAAFHGVPLSKQQRDLMKVRKSCARADQVNAECPS